MKNIVRKIYDFLTKPFVENFYFLFILTLEASIIDVIAWTIYGNPVFGLYMGAHGYIMCYGITLVLGLINNVKWEGVYKRVFFVLGFINLVVDLAIHMTCKVGFTNDMVAIIMGTNISESREFINTYFSLEIVLIIIGAVLLLYILSKINNIISNCGRLLTIPLFCLVLLVSVVVFVRKSENWDGVFINKIITMLSYKTPPDLRTFYTNPKVITCDEEVPDNLVLIIGESFSRIHSSLYGYDKETNPRLGQMVDDSLLVVYDNVTSPSTSTIKTFQSVMSTYKPEYGNTVNWYECTTLMEILSLAGYRTVWISNQSPTGVHDNVVTKYAELCDTTIWVGSKYKGIRKTDFDEQIINALIEDGNEIIGSGKSVIIIHLMGSHYIFNERYPSTFGRFKSEDYPNAISSQSSILSEYDNSILYNDYVVSEIFQIFESRKAVGFYFSDHGLDIFNSSEDYFGHAIVSNPKSIDAAVQIPFVMYLSPSLCGLNPKIKDTVKAVIGADFRTDKTIDLVTSVLGIKVL